jgi:hypothetical protein
MPGQQPPHRLVAFPFAEAVHAQRRGRIVLDVGAGLAAVEHVIGGNVQQRDTSRAQAAARWAGPSRLTANASFRFLLGPVHGGVSGRVDNHIRAAGG